MKLLKNFTGSSKTAPPVTEARQVSIDKSEGPPDNCCSQVTDITPNSAMDDAAGQRKGSDMSDGPETPSSGSAKTEHGPTTDHQPNERSNDGYCTKSSQADLRKRNLDLKHQLRVALEQLEAERGRAENITSKNQELQTEKINIQKELDTVYRRNGQLIGDLEELKHKHNELIQNYNDLHRKFEKKDGNYKKLTKDYMELVRPIHVSDGDHPTIHNRLTSIRVMIENLIQNATKDNYANVDKRATIQLLKGYGVFEGLSFPEADLEYYHLEFYVEFLIMSTLVNCFFEKQLRCVLDLSDKFADIYWWVYRRDSKMATRWRQQLCALAAQDTEAVRVRRDQEVRMPLSYISELVHAVYSNVNMSAKIKDLCYSAFDLAFTMVRIESVIYPEPFSFGMPFDSENMDTPRKSNTAGKVSLTIFPAFRDREGNFKSKSKVWCY
ncbi:hypothetical protein BGX27_002223 [Mortierella sp. AM989]|nr:hypothetical protein BGX27_002223 [Mortierella sp. AM989]